MDFWGGFVCGLALALAYLVLGVVVATLRQRGAVLKLHAQEQQNAERLFEEMAKNCQAVIAHMRSRAVESELSADPDGLN